MTTSRVSVGHLVLCLATLALVGLLLHPPAATAPHRTSASAASGVNARRVLVISVDGLNPAALTKLGPTRLPNLHRLFRRGAGTRNARTQVEQTNTLPNHVSMVTGRRITASQGGHGVTWNDDRQLVTVHDAAGHRVESVFTSVHAAGGTSAVFATKSKFSILDRSWPKAVTKNVIRDGDNAAAVSALRTDLVEKKRSLSFLHLGLADQVGHRRGWLSGGYLDAVDRVDELVGQVLATRDRTWALREHLTIVLTADHGGIPHTTRHRDPSRLANYRVPFVVWGDGVSHGNLYAMSTNCADPGTRRVWFDGTQPVRNGDAANLALDLLGLGPVPGSRWNRDQHLRWN